MRVVFRYFASSGIPTLLLLLVLLSTGAWGTECELEGCSSAYLEGTKAGVEEGPSLAYCSLVHRYIQCTTEYRSTCRGSIQYHSIQRMLSTFMTRNNCTEILQAGGTLPLTSAGSHRLQQREPDGCHYTGPKELSLCALFGDPHLKTFEGQYMTCGVRGAWPLLDTPYLAIQVTNEAVGPDNAATATTKVTVIIKSHTTCGSERTYEASTDALPKAFVDGTTWSGESLQYPYTEVQEIHPGEHILITVSSINATVTVRKIKRYMTVFVTMPSSLLKDFDNGDDFQLCRQGCPTYERLDLPGTNPLGVPAMDKYKARALCKEYNITDYYLDSCIFDLMTTDDMSFRIAAKVALRDHWTQDPIGAKRQLQNCSEPPCVWEVTSMAHIAWPSWVTRLSTLIIVIMNLKSKL